MIINIKSNKKKIYGEKLLEKIFDKNKFSFFFSNYLTYFKDLI